MSHTDDDRRQLPIPAHRADPAPPSVWATAQSSPAVQRKHRYVAASTAHPAKMLPTIAAHAINHYTQPRDVVLDPMCGIGTTLVEAVHLGRDAVGVEYEPRWAAITQANLDLAQSHGVAGTGQVFSGDARRLPNLLPDDLQGQVALVVTSPPYGASAHGQVSTIPGRGVHKRDWTYGNTLDRHNLANLGHRRLLSGFTSILTSCATYLRPGGHVVLTIRPWRELAELVDLPTQVLDCGTRAGLIPVERCVALLARVADDDHLVARGSFFQRDFVRKQRAAGLPIHLIAHEDVAIFQAPPADQHALEMASGRRSSDRAGRCGAARSSRQSW